MTKLFATTGVFAAVLMNSGCLRYVADAYPPPPPPPGPMVMERTDMDEAGYRVAPKPNPRRVASKTSDSHHGHDANGKKPASSPDTAPPEKAGPAESTTADGKPLTPAEIRAAIPLEKVGNPQQTLSSAQIKSVWGDAIGRVRSLSVSGGALKAVEADIGSKKVVRMDSAHLRYVKSRNVILTTMSKPDVEKLPSASKL